MPGKVKIILLGGSGFVGGEIKSLLINKKNNIEILAPGSSELDLLDAESVNNYFKGKITTESSLIVSAVKTSYSALPKDDLPVMLQNTMMATNIIAALEASRCREIIYLSTIDVYGQTDNLIDETSNLHPSSYYAATKIASEMLFKAFSSKTGVPLLILRLSQVFGLNDKSPKLIPSLIKEATKNCTLTITGNGDSLRDYIAVKDVALIIDRAIGQQINDTVNIATGKSISTLDTAKSISKSFLTKPVIKFIDSTKKEVNYRFNIQKLKQYFDIQFSNFETEIRNIIKYYESK